MIEDILKDHDHHVIIDAFKRLQNYSYIKIAYSKLGREENKISLKLLK
jgi:hypothetical protein